MSRKLPLWTPVLIEWEDVYVANEGMTLAEVTRMKPCIRRTLGFVVRITEAFVCIAETDDRKANTEAQVERVNLIPWAYVTKLSVLSEMQVVEQID